MTKPRKYNPSNHPNPVVLQKKIDRLNEKIKKLDNNMSALSQSFAVHIDHLANFARHDMGNAIQNLYATLKNIKDEIDPLAAKEIHESINVLEATLDNLGKVVHFDKHGEFTLPELINACEILTRSSLHMNQIEFSVAVDRTDKTKICQPFQGILQMIHNIVLNAIKSFNDKIRNRVIKLDANISDGMCVMKIKNNGDRISDDVLPYIFDYGFTTTSGSGIGLAYATYLCDEMNGEISVERDIDGFSTVFTLKFPISK